MNDDHSELSWADGPLGRPFTRRTVTIGPGETVAYDEATWRGAIVAVERGEVELHCRAGGRRRFATGDILSLDGLGIRRLVNPGPVPLVLVAVVRR